MTHHPPTQMRWMADYKTEWIAQRILVTRDNPRFEKILRTQGVKTFEEYMNAKNITLLDYNIQSVPQHFIEDTNNLVKKYSEKLAHETINKKELEKIAKEAIKTIESYIK